MTKFAWYSLDRQNIINFLHLIDPLLVSQQLTIPQFHRILVNHIKKYLPIKFKKNKNPLVKVNEVWVGGTYYSDFDQERKKCIQLVLEYSLFDEEIKISRRNWNKMCCGIADTLLHEVIHMRQYRRRKFKILPDYASTAEKQELRQEQSYLGCSDEIDAYSFNIACELYDKFNGDPASIINYLNENQKGKRRRHNSWRMYLKAFQHDHNHPIIQRVKTKVVRYLPFAEIGKPYRNKDWIDR